MGGRMENKEPIFEQDYSYCDAFMYKMLMEYIPFFLYTSVRKGKVDYLVNLLSVYGNVFVYNFFDRYCTEYSVFENPYSVNDFNVESYSHYIQITNPRINMSINNILRAYICFNKEGFKISNPKYIITNYIWRDRKTYLTYIDDNLKVFPGKELFFVPYNINSRFNSKKPLEYEHSMLDYMYAEIIKKEA